MPQTNEHEDASPLTSREKTKREAEDRDAATMRLPGGFRSAAEFRSRMEQGSERIPRLTVPALPVYLVLISFIVWWCWYGWQYHNAHDHSSLKALLVFFVVLVVPILSVLMFKDLHERVRMYPVLKRTAGIRPGAFLVVNGGVPTLFYARADWIGQVIFQPPNEVDDASTRLVARIKEPRGWLEVRRKRRLEKMRGKAEQDAVLLPESEFARTFAVSGANAEFGRRFLGPKVTGAIMRLAKLGNPRVDVDGYTVSVEVEKNLSGGYREAGLRRFLEDAETVVESVSTKG
jgi:hypothetical protein